LKKESSLDQERNLRMTKENELKKLQEAYDSLIEEIDKMKIQKQKDLKELKDDYDN
jgi:soluble cytochrome b562